MDFELIPRLTNVVVTAQHHRPAILNGDFLSACGIVPENWNVVESSPSDGLSTVEFHNGVFWSLDKDNLIIEDGRYFDLGGEIEIHSLARNYIREVRAIPYRALGLNFYLAFPAHDPHAWIADRFMPADLHLSQGHGIRVSPRFSVNSGGATVTVIFGGPETDFDDPSPWGCCIDLSSRASPRVRQCNRRIGCVGKLACHPSGGGTSSLSTARRTLAMVTAEISNSTLTLKLARRSHQDLGKAHLKLPRRRVKPRSAAEEF